MVKKERPQDRYNKKKGYISKSYKLQQSVVDEFKEACDKADISLAGQLTKMMTEFSKSINQQGKNK